MPALNFQPQWADAVEIGALYANGADHALVTKLFAPRNDMRPKRTTVRKPGRAQPGQMLYLFTGQRTAQCRRLGEVRCLAVTRFAFYADFSALRLGAQTLWPSEAEQIARLDTAGLWDWEELVAFFQRTYGDQRDFELICW
jgi:hypothetical protein